MGTGAKIARRLRLPRPAGRRGRRGRRRAWAPGGPRASSTEATGGLDKMAAKADEIGRWEKQANANPYTPPGDGVIPEARFVKFLETRKRVYSVYEAQDEADLRALQKKSEAGGDKLSPSDLWSAGLLPRRSARSASRHEGSRRGGGHERAGDTVHPGRGRAVGRASDAEKQSGKMPAEAGVGVDVAGGEGDGGGHARGPRGRACEREGAPGSQQLSPEDAEEKARDAMAQLGEDAGNALAVPKANVELFRKYEADIKKYAMHGLAFIGL